MAITGRTRNAFAGATLRMSSNLIVSAKKRTGVHASYFFCAEAGARQVGKTGIENIKD